MTYLGRPNRKVIEWCKAHYRKPLPKDPSEGGFWTVKVEDEWWAEQLNIPGNTIKIPYIDGYNYWAAENINSTNGYINIDYMFDENCWQVNICAREGDPDAVWTARQDGSITDTTIPAPDLGGLVITWSPE